MRWPASCGRAGAGDVVGVYLDMDHNTLLYTLNGEELGNAMALLDPPVNFHNLVAADQGLYPAVSMIVHQHCSVNFGDRPFRYEVPRWLGVGFGGVSARVHVCVCE
jgi:hypothetical protein